MDNQGKESVKKRKWGIPILAMLLVVSCAINAYFAITYIIVPNKEKEEGVQYYEKDDDVDTHIVFDGALKTGSDKTVDLLFVGNSITLTHPNNEYWWGTWGGCATTRDNDYVHLLSKAVSKNYPVRMEAMNLATWETQYTDRAEMLDALEPYLRERLDYVVVFLGENVGNTETLESDFEYLIKYVGEAAPNAQILIVGQFWTDEVKDTAKRDACEATGATYVDLTDLRDKEEYQCGLNTVVWGDDGEQHVVKHPGVAKHPGNAGMEKIAEKIAEQMNVN